MRTPIKALLTAGTAACLLLGNAAALPAFAAEDLTLRSGIWLMISGQDKIYYLLGEDGNGEICMRNEHLQMTYTQSGSRLIMNISAPGYETENLDLSYRQDTYYASQSGSPDYPLIYLQPVTEADSKKYFTDGDITQDGNFSIYDSTLVLRYLLGTYQMSNVQITLADMNHDHTVNAVDLSLMKRALLRPQTGENNQPDKPEEPDQPQIPEEPDEPVITEPMQQSANLDAIEYSQHPAYPTGCESIALYILLKYYDTDVTPEQIIEALPKGPLPYQQNGNLYGANPEREFVGDPTTNYSYGVFNEPIAQTAELFRPGVITKKDVPLEDVFAIVSSGQPVVAWYTTTPYRDIIYKNSWYDYETGELIRWPGGEHAVVVCGYDLSEQTITYRDPNTGGTNTLEIELFRKIYDELGGRIVYYEE